MVAGVATIVADDYDAQLQELFRKLYEALVQLENILDQYEQRL